MRLLLASLAFFLLFTLLATSSQASRENKKYLWLDKWLVNLNDASKDKITEAINILANNSIDIRDVVNSGEAAKMVLISQIYCVATV